MLTPETKHVLAVVPFTEGGDCALEGDQMILGAVTLAMKTGQTEESPQAIESLGSFENNSMEIVGDKTYVESGKALVRLASGSTSWSFH